ncbi:MAG TPA: glycosyltransferase [Firmicutes bacterium]|nr:glycosyltransferase [Bacillota bacterium]
MKVAILAMFNGLTPTYSLVNVVAEHLTMLLNHKIEVKLLVTQDCPDSSRYGIFLDERIEWIKVTNRYKGTLIHWEDYSSEDMTVHDTFFDEADEIAKDFAKYLKDVTHCIMHDIHYQGWHLVHNIAIRAAQKELPHVKFIAMTHSMPVNRPIHVEWPISARYTPMENTVYAYPTSSGLSALAKQYNISEDLCFAINNSLNLIEDMNDEIKFIASRTNLIEPDLLIVYPARLTTGKQCEKIAALGGVFKKEYHQTVKIIYCDFESMDINTDTYKTMIINEGINYGLSIEDMVFTSDLGFLNGVKRQTVLELFTLSNLYICPSYAESFGLTILEAASRGNFLVLNQAVPALEELGQHLSVHYMRWPARNFGFDTLETYHPTEFEYLKQHAFDILNHMWSNAVLQSKNIVRKRYNPQWIYKNQLEPLLFP